MGSRFKPTRASNSGAVAHSLQDVTLNAARTQPSADTVGKDVGLAALAVSMDISAYFVVHPSPSHCCRRSSGKDSDSHRLALPGFRCALPCDVSCLQHANRVQLAAEGTIPAACGTRGRCRPSPPCSRGSRAQFSSSARARPFSHRRASALLPLSHLPDAYCVYRTQRTRRSPASPMSAGTAHSSDPPSRCCGQ